MQENPLHSKVRFGTAWFGEGLKQFDFTDFQLQHARREWAEERTSWRAVIYLNLIRNIIRVLDILVREMTLAESENRPGSSTTTEYISDSDGETPSSGLSHRFTGKHNFMKRRLGPLRSIQTDLESKLGPETREVRSTTSISATPFDSTVPPLPRRPSRDVGVNSTNGWKSALEKLRPSIVNSARLQRRRDADRNEITDVLLGCKEAMLDLWQDPVVQQVLAHRKTKIEDSPGLWALRVLSLDILTERAIIVFWMISIASYRMTMNLPTATSFVRACEQLVFNNTKSSWTKVRRSITRNDLNWVTIQATVKSGYYMTLGGQGLQ
jgi:hypothetical protein